MSDDFLSRLSVDNNEERKHNYLKGKLPSFPLLSLFPFLFDSSPCLLSPSVFLLSLHQVSFPFILISFSHPCPYILFVFVIFEIPFLSSSLLVSSPLRAVFPSILHLLHSCPPLPLIGFLLPLFSLLLFLPPPDPSPFL